MKKDEAYKDTVWYNILDACFDICNKINYIIGPIKVILRFLYTSKELLVGFLNLIYN